MEMARSRKIILRIPSIHTCKLTRQVKKGSRQEQSQKEPQTQEAHDSEHHNEQKASSAKVRADFIVKKS